MATTDGTIIYDGTRLVTTATGTAGQILTSNGAGVAPTYQATADGLLISTTVLTSSQVKNLHGTPIQAVAAPGAGNVVNIVNVFSKMTYGGSNVFVAGAGQFIAVMYAPVANNNRPYNAMLNAAVVAAASSYTIGGVITTTAVATQYENAAIQLYVTSVTEISGNAANDNTITVQILYRIITI